MLSSILNNIHDNTPILYKSVFFLASVMVWNELPVKLQTAVII